MEKPKIMFSIFNKIFGEQAAKKQLNNRFKIFLEAVKAECEKDGLDMQIMAVLTNYSALFRCNGLDFAASYDSDTLECKCYIGDLIATTSNPTPMFWFVKCRVKVHEKDNH